MRKLMFFLSVISIVLSSLYISGAYGGLSVVKGKDIPLDFTPDRAVVCEDALVITGRYQKQDHTAVALDMFSLKEPDNPQEMYASLSSDEYSPVSDIVCTDDDIYVFRGKKPMVAFHWDGENYVDMEVPSRWVGYSGVYVDEDRGWKFDSGLYVVAPFTDNILYFIPKGGDLSPVRIDKGDMPQMVSMTFYPTRVYKLSEDTLLLIGGGAWVVKMTTPQQGKVIRYLNTDVSSGGIPASFGRYPIRVGDKVVGWGSGAEEGGIYVYDISHNTAEFIPYQDIDRAERFASFGVNVYALSSPNNDGLYTRLHIINIKQPRDEYTTVVLKKPAIDVAAYRGRVYVLTEGDMYNISVYQGSIFTDMSPSYWAYDAATFLVGKGILSGYPDGSFKPDKEVSRGEYAKILATARRLHIPKTCSLNEFKDVKQTDWYCPYVEAVYKAGYMVGYGKGIFAPNNTVKKEEILTTIVRLRGWKLIYPDVPTFTDIDKDYWAYPYIETAQSYGVILPYDKGLTNGRVFGRGLPATRAQTAVLIYRGLFGR